MRVLAPGLRGQAQLRQAPIILVAGWRAMDCERGGSADADDRRMTGAQAYPAMACGQLPDAQRMEMPKERQRMPGPMLVRIPGPMRSGRADHARSQRSAAGIRAAPSE